MSNYQILNKETILDVVINSTGNASIFNLDTILNYNDITTWTPLLMTYNVNPPIIPAPSLPILLIPNTVTINSNTLNDITNVYGQYPILDNGYINPQELSILINDYDFELSLIPIPS